MRRVVTPVSNLPNTSTHWFQIYGGQLVDVILKDGDSATIGGKSIRQTETDKVL